ncbi:MAG: hypothetical protein A2X61_03065 [Ignavibacteria bacterium GWB2_35_12]|nr:MAG: hypothetical protein A2X61_03065 [Ignavibacteria bacterium GWB2_35_12]OGU95493.1 MAG: hypothetical protein A2220_07240 [Ignavibacteria bacterium RIFOXYA2_FULL_35_10]OGV20790.1 MAG: hypothetical protein A2475_11480 [Ignavibacteria bacterium RIFOXYC2_FULL_35_21]
MQVINQDIKKVNKILIFIIFLLSFSYLQSQAKLEIQIVSPSDMESLSAVIVDFQWVPLKEKDIKYKLFIARLVDTGMNVKNYPRLEEAPKSYFQKGSKIFQELMQGNTYKIDDITNFLNDKPSKGKKDNDKKKEGITNIHESPMEFYAWQVEAYKDKKLIASSSINIFLWNKIAAPPDVFVTELIEPEDGAVVNPDNVKFCWKGGDKGIQYHLNFIYEEKDTNIHKIQAGPFDYLILTQEKKTLDSLIYTIDSVEIGFWGLLLKKLEDNAGNIKTYNDKFSALKSKLVKRAKTSGISLTKTSCELPDSCESEPVCDRLKPKEYYHRELFKTRYKCLIDKIHSENMDIQSLLTTYSKQQKNWINTENRAIDFGIYDNFVNFISVLCDGKLKESESDALQTAYSIVNCLVQNQKQLYELTKCNDFVKNSIDELKTECNQYKNDLVKLKNAVELQWKNDSIKIDSDIGLAAWEAIGHIRIKAECCPPNSNEINLVFPPYDDINSCYKIFNSALNKYLGDRLCYLHINITYDCNTNNVVWTWKGPEKHKLPDCYLKFDVKETIGILTEDGNEKTKCFPINETDRKTIKNMFAQHPNGKWEIETYQDNFLVSAITGREIYTKPLPKTDSLMKIEEKTNPVKNCNCVMRLLFNRIGVPPLNQKRGVLMGVPAEIAIDGKCQGDCIELEKIIRVINPDVYFAAITLPTVPILVYSPVLIYDFPYCGKYTIYGTTLCSDSVSGNDKFYAESKCTITNLEQSSDASMRAAPDCPSCGCINLYYMNNKIKASIINNFLYLGKPQKVNFIYESRCFANCSADKYIEWQIVDPNAKKTIKKGKNLKNLKYNFTKKGKYKICIVEKTQCGGKTEECSIFLTVDTGQ